MLAELGAYLHGWAARWDIDWFGESTAAILLRELSAAIVPAGDPATWQRRPSISLDGTPLILSRKIGARADDTLRLLVEPGSYAMTVAQQITFSLMRLDRLLGQLGWLNAAAEINSITAEVLPADPALTSNWWGGLWLGGSISPPACSSPFDTDLRIYLNLRHGSAATRWRTVAAVILRFVSFAIDRCEFEDWIAHIGSYAVPVGLGIVVAGGRVPALRIYVGLRNPTLASLSACFTPSFCEVPRELVEAQTGYCEKFGPMRPQAVTIGYDFFKDAPSTLAKVIRRVKVDICCHLLTSGQCPMMLPWINQILTRFSFDCHHLRAFLDDVHSVWRESEVQFVSLGFAPTLRHITVYVKPNA